MITPEFIIIAFFGGLLTFFSPCIAPLMPGYLTFLAGTSMHDDSKHARRIALLTSLSFVLGLATVFSLIGGVLTIVLAGSAASITRILEILGGILIISFGILMSGFVRIPFLEREIKWHPHKGASRYPNAFLFGAAFGIGWTPCVGAILGAILTLAIVEPFSAFPLLFTFSLGIGVPFIILALFTEPMTRLIRRSKRAFRIVTIVSSVILILLGITLVTGDFQRLATHPSLMVNLEWIDDIQDSVITWLITKDPATNERGTSRSDTSSTICDPMIMDCVQIPVVS
jgi:cytochrome c-type biogenesis protein